MNEKRSGPFWISMIIFGFLWADLIRNLGVYWSTNPQYAYGWTVPALSLFLLWESWITRPAPGAPRAPRLAVLCMGMLAALLLPTRLLLEIAPDWRLAQWSLAAIVIGISLGAAYLLGSLPWLAHFAFPIAFILVAVPWPVKIEQPLIQTLSDWVSVATVNGLNLCDVPAIKQGNVIEISAGRVGVEEACSGVRSFQATFMASLFLGQLWSFALRFRLLLIGTGIAFAFLCNIIRALLLSFVAEKKGLEAIDKWHDPAGFTILGITFLGLLGLALLLRPKAGTRLAAPEKYERRTLPWGLTGTLAVWLAFVAVGTELWYRTAKPPAVAWWRVEWPEDQPKFTDIPISEKVREMEFHLGRQARWKDDDGSDWTMFYFRWLPGLATSRNFARWHNPDQCLTSLGFTRVAEYEPTLIRHGEIELLFQTLRFDLNRTPNYVFFCVWEDRKEPGGPKLPEQWTVGARFRAVLDRKRRLGQQVLEVVIAGVEDPQAARAAFERKIPQLLRPDSILPASDPIPSSATGDARASN